MSCQELSPTWLPGIEESVAELQRLQGEFASCLQALNGTYEGMQAALRSMPQEQLAQDQLKLQRHPQAQASPKREHAKEKFELLDGVPTMTKAPKSQNTALSKKNSQGNLALAAQKSGLRLLDPRPVGNRSAAKDDWSESFVVSEEDAIVMYNHLYSTGLRPKIIGSKESKRFSSVRYNGLELSDSCSAWVNSLHYFWQICTLVLVVLDTVLIPLTLAWPDVSEGTSPAALYFEVGPYLWSFDICMSFVPSIMQKSLWSAVIYLCTRFPLDAGLVTLDMVLLLELVEKRFRVFSLVRLMRILKFRGVMVSLENRLAAKGNMKFVLYLTIFQCIAQVLAVNHVLACLLFYVGVFSKEQELTNWIDTYGVGNYEFSLQYMQCFNWAIAQYTPAPFPYQPQNEFEQAVVIVVILTCLPLLGAQIGKIGGTLNLLKEKAKERDTVRR
ncbi:GIP, partial [Symbiodinium sp. KB8]